MASGTSTTRVTMHLQQEANVNGPFLAQEVEML
jgi:hypothetical protein